MLHAAYTVRRANVTNMKMIPHLTCEYVTVTICESLVYLTTNNIYTTIDPKQQQIVEEDT